MIAQSWETLDGLSLHNPGKPQMSYDCTILGNPRWLIIAQSWETLDGLSLHNHGKPQMVCDCAIHLLHDVINQLSAEPLFVWKVFGMWMEFRVLFAYTASVDYPPILGGWAKDKFFHKCIYEYIEKNFLSPSFLLIWGGYCSFCSFRRVIDSFCVP